MELYSILDLPEWLILLATVVVLLYKYATRYANYWKEQNVPYEKLSLFWGTPLQYMRKPFHLVEHELCKKHGRLFGSFEDGKPVLYVAEPELLKTVFVKDFSVLSERRDLSVGDELVDNMMLFAPLEQWRKLRSATSPAMTTGRLRKMNSIINNCARRAAEYLERVAEGSGTENVKRVFGHYSLDVLSSCAFGTKLEPHTAEAECCVATADTAFFAEITAGRAVHVLFQNFIDMLHKDHLNKKTFHFFEGLTKTIMRKREEARTRQDDFLQMMINAKQTYSEVLAEGGSDTEGYLFDVDSQLTSSKGLTVKDLTEKEAISQCVLFYVAGQGTTSTLVALTLHLLAVHPEVQDKLRKEVDEVFEKCGPSPSYDDISKMSYMNAVVSETLRLYPPGTRTERSPPRDGYVLGDTGIKVMRNGIIVIPTYSLHHDPEFFPDPESFKPERFSEENISSIRPYTFLPFGAGPRNCIGMRLGLHIVKTCLLHALHTVQFVRTSETKVPPDFRIGLGLLTVKEVRLGIRKRTI